MANFQYSSDLVNYILHSSGEAEDGTSDFDSKALELLNRAYQALWMGGAEIDSNINENWWWLLATPPKTLILEPRINGGTVSVTNNNSSITFSSAPSPAISSTVKDWFFKVDDHSDVFRVSAHTASSTSATLDSVYTGDTDTAANYKLMRLEYTLDSSVLRLVSPIRIFREGLTRCLGMSLSEMEEKWPLNRVQSGIPRNFAPVGEQKVRFSHYGGTSSTDLIRVEYDFLEKPDALTDSGSEEPKVPFQYRHILADWGVFLLREIMNDSRANDAAALAKSGLLAMSKENQQRWATMGREMGKIIPRQRDLAKTLRPLRTESGLIIG